MKQIKDALLRFLGYKNGTVISYTNKDSVIIGSNNQVYVLIKHPNGTPEHTWDVYVYPRVCVDTRWSCGIEGCSFDSDDNVCAYFDSFDSLIYEAVLNNLSKAFKELMGSYEYQSGIGEGRDPLE